MDGILFCGIILFFFYNFVLYLLPTLCAISVVVATAKVRIFKQITTLGVECYTLITLLLLPQRYEFSSKSQPCVQVLAAEKVVVATAKVRIFKQITTTSLQSAKWTSCCCYRKGTNFQANHNSAGNQDYSLVLLLLPQRYEFSSKSQHVINVKNMLYRCCLEECFYRQAMRV